MTGTTTMETGRRPRRWRIVALVSSLSLALAGLVGLGLAPAASAETTCPDGYTLNAEGTICTMVQTQPADPVYFCDEGWGDPYPDPDGEGMLCSRDSGEWQYADANKRYTCEVGDPFQFHGAWKCNSVRQETPDTEYYCEVGELVSDHGTKICRVEVPCVGATDVDLEHRPPAKCYNDLPAQTRPSCDHGYTLNAGSGMCEKPITVPADSSWVCDDGWVPAWADVNLACEDDRTPQCKKPIIETVSASVLYTCPVGWVGPLPMAESTDVLEVQPYCELTLTATPTVTTAGGPPFVDYCPNLAGDQWDYYDCNTPQAVAAEVVTPAEPATAAPAAPAAPTVVGAAEAATVAAPAPAAVSAGVAGTAAVADTATVPAAIPAGDGSQAPTVPIWTLAMIVVGVLGTAVAGRKLVSTK